MDRDRAAQSVLDATLESATGWGHRAEFWLDPGAPGPGSKSSDVVGPGPEARSRQSRGQPTAGVPAALSRRDRLSPSHPPTLPRSAPEDAGASEPKPSEPVAAGAAAAKLARGKQWIASFTLVFCGWVRLGLAGLGWVWLCLARLG